LIISRLCVAAEAILLGFQHYLVMLGTTVLIPSALVPQMGGGNVRPGEKNHFADISCLSLTEYGGLIVVFVEREGGGDPDTSLCCWPEHVAPEFVWHSFACCYWRLLHLCPNHNFNYPCWSI